MRLRSILESLPSSSGDKVTAGRLGGAEKIRGHIADFLDHPTRSMDTLQLAGMTLCIRYRTWKLRALMWILRRMRPQG